jgi:hypothetical protein
MAELVFAFCCDFLLDLAMKEPRCPKRIQDFLAQVNPFDPLKLSPADLPA